jgi:hypothetical protein
VLQHTQTSQRVDSVDVHRTATADTLTAASSEGKRRVDFIFNTDQSVEHHGTGLVQVQRVRLHARLRGGLVGVPSVDMEGLGARGLGWVGVLDSRRLGLGHKRAAAGRGLSGLGDRVDSGIRSREHGGLEQRARRGQQAGGSAKGGHGEYSVSSVHTAKPDNVN